MTYDLSGHTSRKVFTEHNEYVCVVTSDKGVICRNYGDADVIFQPGFEKYTVLEVGEFIAGFILEHADRIDSNDGIYKFVIPMYGNTVVLVKFTGIGMTDIAYINLVCAVAELICTTAYGYCYNMLLGKNERTLIPSNKDKMAACLAEEYDALKSEGSKHVEFPGYNKISQEGRVSVGGWQTSL